MSQGAKALGSRFRRTPQGVAPFAPNDPHSGYYNDLTTEALRHGSAAGAGEALRRMTADRRVANPITIAQLGLGSLQLRDSDSRWLEVARHAAVWVADNLDEMGLLAFHFSMPHTFRLVAPWSSSMAQGEAVSLLVRAGGLFHDRDYDACGARAMRSLLDPAGGLVTATPEGSVLQEYPTSPPAHVLNGWIFSLWGLYDYSLAGNDHALAAQAGTAFNAGSRTLNERLHLYSTAVNWSRYDLLPRRMQHVASPFYHRLHVAQLEATARLCPELTNLETTASRWRDSGSSPMSLALAVARKVAFRFVTPRRSIS